MRKSLVKTIVIGVIAGIACFIVPSGSYNNTPVAIYQQPFNVAVFYLMYFAIQMDFFYEHSMFDIRCKTIFRAKLLCISRTELFSLLYIIVYFLASCAVSLLISPDNTALCFSPFSIVIWLTSSVVNLSILNILSVNLNYLIKKSAIILVEITIILSGLAMCFAAPNLVPFICVWFYGVYPKPVISPAVSLFVYLIWGGIALLVGFIPIKEVLRRERR